jgi:hypothetical protein
LESIDEAHWGRQPLLGSSGFGISNIDNASEKQKLSSNCPAASSLIQMRNELQHLVDIERGRRDFLRHQPDLQEQWAIFASSAYKTDE